MRAQELSSLTTACTVFAGSDHVGKTGKNRKDGTRSGHIFRTAHSECRSPVGHIIPTSIADLKIG
jgi:hypothetical protein